MRVAHVLLAIATISTLPRPTDAGIWSWFDKPAAGAEVEVKKVEEKKENEEGAPKVVATTEDVPPAAVVKEAIAAEEAAIVVEEAVVPEVVAEVPIVETEPDTLPDDVPIEESLPVVDEEQGNVETPPQQEEDSSAGAGATTTTITNDPQLSGAHDFVAWFRSHGGIGKSIILWSNCSRLDFSDSLTAMIQSYIN